MHAEDASTVAALVDAYHSDPAGFAVFNSGPEARLIAEAYSGVEPDARTAPVVQWAREELYRLDDLIDWNFDGARDEGIPLDDYRQQRARERALQVRQTGPGPQLQPTTYNEAVAKGTRRAVARLAEPGMAQMPPGAVETPDVIETRRILTRESAFPCSA